MNVLDAVHVLTDARTILVDISVDVLVDTLLLEMGKYFSLTKPKFYTAWACMSYYRKAPYRKERDDFPSKAFYNGLN